VRAVRTSRVIGLIAQVTFLAVLNNRVGLGLAGWVVGTAFGLLVNTAIARRRPGCGAAALGPANQVTLARATLVGGVAALVADAFVGPIPVSCLVLLVITALGLDAVDGRVARRTHTVSAFGARFDMEVDAVLIFVLSVYVALSVGLWVLLIGIARYAFGAAGWFLPWLRGSVPASTWRKVVAVIQGVSLMIAAADLLPARAIAFMLVVALALLAGSFGTQTRWLWRHRPAPEQPEPVAGLVLAAGPRS
jgi:phosphatidylglycerophosphate synthase